MRIYSLSKKHRLHKAAEFQSVIRFRRMVSGEFFQLYVKPSNLDYSRLGLIVAKKMVRQAIKRNRLKRLLREVFRIHQQELDNMDCVFRLQRALTQIDSIRIRQEAKMLILKLRMQQWRD
ncbi:ribonuclease P protein component [Nitrosomonas communis]|uniref:ribonuclease P protein component n=1 Tax=Nitrosomonas communis TaxID=44574 RepID=UPI0026EBE4BD|nr:ribonuclease P protein component [Nitrosomonas communis]MCO6428247.1 ribonuclease P protein component [Nitrosomonas communis]